MHDLMARTWTFRVVDILAKVLWVLALATTSYGTMFHPVPGGGDWGRWGVFLAVAAAAATCGALSLWVVDVLRNEFQMGKLQRVYRKDEWGT